MNFKRYDIYFVVLILLVFSALMLMGQEQVDSVVFQTRTGNVTVMVETAQTTDELRTGLMYRESLPESSGMLFVFGQPSVLNFWMKNTLIPLDMMFISEDLRIVKIEHNVLPCTADPCPNYGGVYGKYVVEVNAGFCEKNNILEGDEVHLIIRPQP